MPEKDFRYIPSDMNLSEHVEFVKLLPNQTTYAYPSDMSDAGRRGELWIDVISYSPSQKERR